MSELEAKAAPVLSSTNRRQFGRSEARQRSYFAGRAVLAEALERWGIATTVAPHPSYGYLMTKAPEVFVNISHTKSVAVAAVASAPIGIDVESVDRDASRVLERVASEEERAAATSGVALWSAKEAFSKAVGLGLKFGLHQFEILLSGPEPIAVSTALEGPLMLRSPAIRQITARGYIISICTEIELLRAAPSLILCGGDLAR